MVTTLLSSAQPQMFAAVPCCKTMLSENSAGRRNSARKEFAARIRTETIEAIREVSFMRRTVQANIAGASIKKARHASVPDGLFPLDCESIPLQFSRRETIDP